jgi:putative phage-type endonuclease
MYSSNIDIKTALAAISNHKPIAQKSTEWLAARKNLIAASEAGYLLGIRSTSSMINYIKGKCNISTSLDNLGMLDSIRHGNIYEDVSRAIYQSRHNLIVKEYGLITTSKHSFLGASPDGIVIQEHRSGDDKIRESRIGRLVEIKNPYDYDPSDVIKPEYAVQILQQQCVLDLSKCDFVKTNIIGASVNEKTASKGLNPYRDIDAFLADILTTPDLDTHPQANKNIPTSNMTSKGMEKGIIIHYKDSETGQSITNLYPLDTPYTKAGILEWIKTTKETISSNTGICKSKIAVEYWYLAAYFEKVIEYDTHLFENIYLPRLELVWQLITRIRQLQELYSSELIINFIDNILKPHINKPSAFYKLPTNQMDICNLLETALQLDVKSNGNADNEKSKSKDKSKNNEKDKSSAKTPRAATALKTKVEIEYDF